ncbi:UbiA prenyltransferase [Melanomma pulvis-pyrius CBS 109.77]|uniref:UbiA prenyltransferase n=1 Tax=Melanomma pulvis-pyrius CBS 109.77 TaxID=1314802 RepID=A0A6A6WW69_9PLEO|nr:UbiA prenyltransferase [Melanomma pulvis-pyrius CBS 109.77]
MSASNPPKKISLAYQYGGNYRSGWLAYLPESWLPYVQLARLSPPVGLFLIYFPHLFGLLLAAIIQRSPPIQVVKSSGVLFAGSFFLSNAIHIWNDLIDAPLDAQVQRTCNRPIPRGAITKTAAFLFTLSQAVGASLLLFALPGEVLHNALYSVPGIIGWTYYPYAKRHTYWTQTVLGFCLSWGIVMGSLSLGLVPYVLETGFVNTSVLSLFVGSTLWTMIYDSVYAFQDLEDDVKANIGSMAVLFKYRIKPVFWLILSLMSTALILIGQINNFNFPFYVVSVGGATISLAVMVANINLKDSLSCWWWFSTGFWYAGGAIAGGLLFEYVQRAIG